MEIIEALPVSFSSVSGLDGDLIVAASGYESRASRVSSLLDVSKFRGRVAIGFKDRSRRGARVANDRFFRGLGFDIVPGDGGDSGVIRELLLDAIVGERCRRIVVDYTSMTTVWYAGLVTALEQVPAHSWDVEVYFVYQPSQYSPPKPPQANAHIGPIDGFCSLRLPDKPTALVIGLGYVPLRSSGLIDYVEPKETIAFIADPAVDKRFVEAVERNNKDTLRRISSENIVRYPLADLRLLEARLSTLVVALQMDYRVILAPLGPKPFALMSLLLARKLGAIDVWRVSSGAKGNVYRRAYSGAPISFCVRFGGTQ